MDFYQFYTGREMTAYEFLGCHVTENGAVFRTFAPAAVRIAVIGEFNNWTEWEMHRIGDGQFWEMYGEGARPGMMYKYRIYGRDGGYMDHCDPYGYGMELRPGNASIIRNMKGYMFQDEEWMKQREDCRNRALNIYELHLGSWKKKGQEQTDWYNYREIAELLVPYVKKNGYNYVEVMPISEHPCDNSWGYQCTGFYSPTARYGTADDLKAFIDICHQGGIGVILDFVPVHFAVDGYGLANYDGTALYEYPHADVGFSEWGSKNFMHSRGEVQSFLQSSAGYWLKEYHFDGLRIDALSNIIYWHGDKNRGVNGNAVDFIRHMNRELKRLYPGVMLIAEDSTAFGGVTKAAEEGGLGFDYKWDMGWMNDTLDYFRLHPHDRRGAYHKLTFSMMYYYDEHFLLPLSHDEVVHGKATILQKMNGQYEEKFPQAKALYMYMYAHPGKKLNFMGNEFGQLREWDEDREQDWEILNYPVHDDFYRFMRELNQIYLENPAFSALDYDREGFRWLECDCQEKCVYIFERRCESQRILAAFNFSEQEQMYELSLDAGTELKLLLASEDAVCERLGSGQDEKVQLRLPAFSGVYYRVL